MSFGKVILIVLATVVIFATGAVTGGFLMQRPPTAGQVAQPFWNRFEMTRRAVELMPDLAPERRARIDRIIRDHQELIADYFRILEPDVQQVFRKMRDSIREELTPDQQKRFEELAKKRAPSPGGRKLFDRPHRAASPSALQSGESGSPGSPRPTNSVPH